MLDKLNLFMGGDQLEKLLSSQRGGACETSRLRGVDDLTDSANVIVVPMRDDDKLYAIGRINADLFQILKRRRLSLLYARIDYHPFAEAQMDDDALADSGAEQ